MWESYRVEKSQENTQQKKKMTIQQFNELKVTDCVHIPTKKNGYIPTNVCATNINRTLKKIKPFLCNKWYSYTFIKRGVAVGGNYAGMCGPTFIIETLINTLLK